MQFDVRYYLIAIQFIIFDLEIIFIVPWATVFRELGVDRPDRNGHLRRHALARLRLRLEEGSTRMGVIQSVSEMMHNPLPEGRLDDILRPEGDNPLLQNGFVTTSMDALVELGAYRFDVADDLRPGLLRGRDDARRRRAPGPGPLRRGVPPVAAPVRRDDRGRHAGQQDGPGAAQGLRPDARAEVGHLDGQLRQRRRLLPLFVLGGSRLRPHRAGRRLRAGLPADRRSAGVRHPAIAEEDPSRHQLRRQHAGRAPTWPRSSDNLAAQARRRSPDRALRRGHGRRRPSRAARSPSTCRADRLARDRAAPCATSSASSRPSTSAASTT